MDQDSCHPVCHTCGHHPGPDSSSHPLSSVPYDTPPWSPDHAGALAAGLHILSIPAGACAAAPHHVAVLHIQPHLQVWTQASQIQEEELTHYDQSFLIYSDFKMCFSTFLNVPYVMYILYICEAVNQSVLLLLEEMAIVKPARISPFNVIL